MILCAALPCWKVRGRGRGAAGRAGDGAGGWGRRQDLLYLPSLPLTLTAPRCAEQDPGTKKRRGEGSKLGEGEPPDGCQKIPAEEA